MVIVVHITHALSLLVGDLAANFLDALVSKQGELHVDLAALLAKA